MQPYILIMATLIGTLNAILKLANHLAGPQHSYRSSVWPVNNFHKDITVVYMERGVETDEVVCCISSSSSFPDDFLLMTVVKCGKIPFSVSLNSLDSWAVITKALPIGLLSNQNLTHVS